MRPIVLIQRLIVLCLFVTGCALPAGPGTVPADEDPVATTATPATVAVTAFAPDTSASDAVLFHVVQDESEVRFTIDEMLFGSPKTVVGRANAITATVAVNMENFADTVIGPVQIDARSLRTDDSFRNRAMRLQILESSRDEYRFITFVSTTLDGLSLDAPLGESLELQVNGELTVRDGSQPVTFVLSVTPISESRLTIVGAARILRSDFGLSIPNVPGIANVADEIALSFALVTDTANAVAPR